MLVKARSMAAISKRFRGQSTARWVTLLPAISALVVVVLGAELIARSITAFT